MHHPLKAELPRRMNRVHVDGNHVLGRKAAFEQQLGQGVFNPLLYGTFERPCSYVNSAFWRWIGQARPYCGCGAGFYVG